ncbi:DUF4232 domain-containing protein [Streptomyces griseoluteus]|uniref:DUF4232 domain-containing protein n=1 Tax=Streptomyces griseoluteus TaxID=29306 RepID=UPI003803DE6A
MKNVGMSRALLAAAAIASASMLAACSSSSDEASSTQHSAAPSTAGTSSLPAGSAASQSAGPDPDDAATPSKGQGGDLPTGSAHSDAGQCAVDSLKISVANVDSGTSTTHFQLAFRNKSGVPCSLEGFPGVSFHGGDGARIGNAAERDVSSAVKKVTLIPNARAVAELQAPNGQGGYSAAACQLKGVSFLGIFVPGSKEQYDVPWKTPECSSPTLHSFKVGPVHLLR